MTKHEFLTAVRAHAQGSGYIPHELEKMLEYYSEMIDEAMEDGATEADAVAGLGTWAEIVEQINASCTTVFVPEDSQKNSGTHTQQNAQTNQTSDSPKRGYVRLPVWAMVLLILSAPLWVPLIFSFLLVLFLAIVIAASLLVALVVTTVALAVVGVVGIPVSIVVLFTVGGANFGFTLATALICVGAAMLLELLCVTAWILFKAVLRGIRGVFRWLFR